MSLFSRLLTLMICAGLVPLVPTCGLMLYYQAQSKINALSVHESMSSVTSVSVKQYLEDTAHRMAFTGRLDDKLAAGRRGDAEDVLKDALSSNPDFLLLSVLDGNGRLITKAGQDGALKIFGELDRSSDEVFLRARKTGRVVFSSFDARLGVPAASFVFPMSGGNYLFGVADFSKLWTGVLAGRIGATGRVVLAEKNGAVFNFYPQNSVSADSSALAALFSVPAGKLEKLKTREGVFVGAYRSVPGTDLYVLTLQARDEAFWMIRLTTSMMLFFLLCIATASYFAAMYYARRLGEPIEELISGAERVSRRNFDTPVSAEKGWGEFSTLTGSFNAMMAELKRYHGLHVDEVLDEKRKLDLLVGLMRDGVVLANIKGEALFMNRVAETALSNCADASTGPGGRKLEAGEMVAQVIHAFMEDSRIADLLEVSVPGASKPKYYKVVIDKFRPKTGEPVIILLLRDISLEHELDEMKNDFFSSVAHDLRAPLLGFQGYLRLMEKSCADATEKEYLAAMKNTSKTLFALVGDILDISRMESGVMQLTRGEFDFNALVWQVYGEIKPVISEKKLSVIMPPGDGNIPVRADERLLERVVYNMIYNAVKYTPSGGSITLAWGIGGGRLSFSVSDTGVGISHDKLNMIFEKYRRADDGEQELGGGYGLGLAIAKKAIELHGGTIKASSEQGKGSKFEFSIPCA